VNYFGKKNGYMNAEFLAAFFFLYFEPFFLKLMKEKKVKKKTK